MSQERPLVSIGIPTYNRAAGYLRQALESALGQTYPQVEIIVSDNASSDDTEQVVTGYRDERIRYFRHPKNIGPNNNFNFCLEQARGGYFLLLHDDDLIDADFVDSCMTAVGDRIEVGIVRTGTRIIDAAGRTTAEAPNGVVGLSTRDFFLGWFQNRTSLFLCSTLFHTAHLRAIGGFKSKTNLFQDVLAEVVLAAKYGRIDVPEIKASFRNHPDEITHSSKVADWCEDSLHLLDAMVDLVPEDGDLIRRQGKEFFCRINYKRAAKLKSFSARMAANAMVFRRFGYVYSPLRYVLATRMRRLEKGRVYQARPANG